jgi:hypothetical protein
MKQRFSTAFSISHRLMGPHGLEFGQFIETSWRTVKNITDVDATF